MEKGIELQVMRISPANEMRNVHYFDNTFAYKFNGSTYCSLLLFIYLGVVTFTAHDFLVVSFAIHSIALYCMYRCSVLHAVLEVGTEAQDPPEADVFFQRRFCDICEIWQPLRTKHCRDTRRCVATFDHYCFFVGAAISEGNHATFICMLALASVAVSWDVYILSISVWNHSGFYFALYITSLGLSVFPLVMVVSLFLYHLYLVLTAQTTWEHLSRENITYLHRVPDGVNPFSRGLSGNIAEFTIRPKINTAIDWVPTWRQGDEATTCCLFDNSYYSCF